MEQQRLKIKSDSEPSPKWPEDLATLLSLSVTIIFVVKTAMFMGLEPIFILAVGYSVAWLLRKAR